MPHKINYYMDEHKRNSSGLTSFLTICMGIIGICGFIQSVAVLPYRVDKNEKSLELLQRDYKESHDLIIRVNQQLDDLTKEIERLRSDARTTK